MVHSPKKQSEKDSYESSDYIESREGDTDARRHGQDDTTTMFLSRTIYHPPGSDKLWTLHRQLYLRSYSQPSSALSHSHDWVDLMIRILLLSLRRRQSLTLRSIHSCMSSTIGSAVVGSNIGTRIRQESMTSNLSQWLVA